MAREKWGEMSSIEQFSRELSERSREASVEKRLDYLEHRVAVLEVNVFVQLLGESFQGLRCSLRKMWDRVVGSD